MVATAWIWLPALLAATALCTPAIAAAALIAVAVAALAIRALAPSFALFLRLKPLSMMLAAAVLVLAWLGSLHPQALPLLIELATCYVYALAHAKQLLAAYANRCLADEWRAWCEQAHWALVGFGAPLALIFRSSLHPLLCLALLECAHASAAVLLQEIGRLRPLTISRIGARKGGPLEYTCVHVREAATVSELASLVERQWREELRALRRNRLPHPSDFPSKEWTVRFLTTTGEPLTPEENLRRVAASRPAGKKDWFWGDHANSQEFELAGLKARAVPLLTRLRDE
jgi:hypothetical protein